MASGFDGTAFNTGLLNGIAGYNERQQKDIEAGQAEQYRAFQEAAHEYDKEKAKASDQKVKIDAMANILSAGHPNPAAYATARDAVEMGYTGQEHLPYVQDAYKRTVQDYVSNPEKWSGVKPASKDPEWDAVFGKDVDDSNPNQTNIIRKFGDQTSLSNIENVRSHKMDHAYQDLPGAAWGNQQDTANANLVNKTRAEAGAKQSLADEKEARQQSDYMLTNPDAQSAPTSNAMPSTGMGQPMPNAEGQQVGGQPQQPINPLAVNSAALKTPGQQTASAAQAMPAVDTQNGIAINAPAPEETQAPMSQTPPPVPEDMAKSPAGLDEEYMKKLQAKNPTGAGIVQQVAAGQIQISPWMLRDRSDGSKSSWWAIIEAAHKYDSNFDMTDYNARNRMHTSYAGGEDHKNIVRLDTAAGHLGSLYIAGKDLDTGNIQALNSLALKYGVQTGATPATTYEAIVSRVAPEIVSAYTPTGGSDADRAKSEDVFKAQMAGDQRDNTLRATAGLLHSRIQSLQNAWDINMGPNKAGKDWFSPNTHDVMKAMGIDETDKHPFSTMQELQSQGQHPLNPNLDKAAVQKQPAEQSGQDWSHVWSQ